MRFENFAPDQDALVISVDSCGCGDSGDILIERTENGDVIIHADGRTYTLGRTDLYPREELP